ncbi:hypothetical protein ACQPYK_09395 [Streptosporangium sp. CA-135522]|uniref:hypothetical protein n=1 Tax=Streptosporangium sp. CA-135522 TaxID=3240072 RepID=UPI003D90CF90
MKYRQAIEYTNIPLPPERYLPAGVRKADKKLRDLMATRTMLRADKDLIEQQIIDATEADRLADIEAVAKGKDLPASQVPELEAKRDELERRIAAMFDLIAEAKHALADVLAESFDAIHALAASDVDIKSAAYIDSHKIVLKARGGYSEALGVMKWSEDHGPFYTERFRDRDYERVAFPTNFEWAEGTDVHQAFNALRDEALSHKPDEQLGYWKGKTDYSYLEM